MKGFTGPSQTLWHVAFHLPLLNLPPASPCPRWWPHPLLLKLETLASCNSSLFPNPLHTLCVRERECVCLFP